VHSLKDLPTFPVEGLALAAVPVRGPTGDVLVSPAGARFDDLPLGAKVATGSLRRRAQVKHRRPDVALEDLRGNVETRLRKLHEHGYDGLILARAGLERLGLAHVITEVLDPAWMLPAVGQGALGLECRAADTPTLMLLAPLNDADTHHAVTAERSLLYHLGGGCQVPIGAAAAVADGRLTLRGAVLAPDGSRRIEGAENGPPADAEAVGRRQAGRLRAAGADELLRLAR
jgi:hydroxymethylbilane synthase